MGLWYEPNLLIDGELAAATGARTFPSINPATEEVIAEAADASVADVERAIAAARRAFDETTWSTDAKFRATCLRQLAVAMRPRTRFDDAVAMAKGMMEGLNVGDPSDPANYLGPLISAKQRDKVQAMVDRAVAAGATVVTGGSATDHERGFYFRPTLIINAEENSEIAQDEVFGPVLVMFAHDGDDDAVRFANNSRYGLSGAVMATDRERALAAARRVRTGTMSVNGGLWHAPDAPFGGYKQSGVGRENAVAGLEEFLQTKVLAEPQQG